MSTEPDAPPQQPAQEQTKEPAPDRSPEAKDAAIKKLREAEPNIHFDTAYGILRGDPAFDANDPNERIYIMGKWGTPPEKAPEEEPKQ